MQAARSRLRMIPRHRDLVGACAEAVTAHFEDALPDLRRAVILMPHHLQQRRLRRCLLECAGARGHEAVLPPVITTFRVLFRERVHPLHEQPVLSPHERKLLLATALDEHPGLLPRAGRWEFAEQLLQLFDDISANRAQEQPAESPAQNPAQPAAQNPVQTLYDAWRKDRAQTPDMPTLYHDSLRGRLGDALTRADEHVFLCGFGDLPEIESAWAARLYRQGRLTLITYAGGNGRYPSPALETVEAITGGPPAPAQTGDALSCLLDAAFASDGTAAARARAAAGRFADSPAAGRIGVFKPESLEQHAFGIYLKIREWLDAGISPVAVVSQDRKLSRRLRAVLERADIPLCDHAGWALSTTSSAAAVAALLPPQEQGFGGDTVLTLARSPYCRYGLDVMRAQRAGACLARAVAELEPFRDFDETTAALQALNLKDRELGEDVQRIVSRIHDALNGLRDAATGARQPFAALFKTLLETMDALGMTEALQKDAAGRRLLEELEAMAAAARTQGGDGGWSLWRRWILHALEHENFIPKERSHLVELYNLSHSSLVRPAGLILTALDAGHALPAEPMPLLDEDARRALGLKGRNWRIAVQFERFREALESAEHVLLTCQLADNGQRLTPVPWLDGLQHFHALAYGCDLEERDLGRRAQAEMRAAAETSEDAPARPQMPAPLLPAWPARLSVGTVQAAVACPYRFFAKASLNLTPAPEADDYDSARRYGLQLHRCLAALHTDDEKLPGPMDKPWTEEHRGHALALAQAIVKAEFSPFLNRHYSVAERMEKMLAAVNWYVDWLIGNTAPDARFETETRQAATLGDGLELHGRTDCVIHECPGVRILDYKSGHTPSGKEIAGGEDIQLTAYALFYDDVKAVAYMDMKDLKPVQIEGGELDEARKHLRERLETFKRDAADKPLPAWADDEDCKYCAYPGVCRRDAWRGTETGTPSSEIKSERNGMAG